MKNYTKYALKAMDELAPYLAEADKVFVLACNKCFKEFETADEPECAQFTEACRAMGKTVTGAMRVDFLCNAVQTEKKLRDLIPEETERVFVVSCGLASRPWRGSRTSPCWPPPIPSITAAATAWP